jgi:hypothetical protein
VKGKKMNEERLQELIAEATIDCYDEDEEFWGMLATLEDELDFPLTATLIGEAVELIGLDGPASSSHRGIVAQVRRKGQIYSVSLADLQVTDSDSHSAEWLAAYHYWLRY